jgi:hypothetical protein
MGKTYWIVIIVIILWQVIASAVQNAAKKQQQRQMAEEAQQRRSRAATQTGSGPRLATSTRAPTRPGGAPVGLPTQTRKDDLAARRQAQLEELRRRRSQGASPAPTIRTAPTTMGQPGTQPVPVPTRQPDIVAGPTRTQRTELAKARAAEERTRRRRETRKQRKSAQTQRAAAVEPVAVPAEAPAPRRPRVETPVEPDAYETQRSRTSERAAALVARLGDRDTLRDLFVLKEILDQPVALRPKRVGF